MIAHTCYIRLFLAPHKVEPCENFAMVGALKSGRPSPSTVFLQTRGHPRKFIHQVCSTIPTHKCISLLSEDGVVARIFTPCKGPRPSRRNANLSPLVQRDVLYGCAEEHWQESRTAIVNRAP